MPKHDPLWPETAVRQSLAALLADVGLTAVTVKLVERDSDGYFFFLAHRRGPSGVLRECEISVPPLAPERLRSSLVRFYVDGNSWMWKFAVNTVRAALMERCPVCEGEGSDESTVRVVGHDGHGPIVSLDDCPHCHGKGTVEDNEFERLRSVPKPRRPGDVPVNATIQLRF